MMEETHEMKTEVKEENHEMKIEKENHVMKTEVKEENHEMKIEEEENQKMKIEEDESHEMKTEVKQEENEVKVEQHQDQEADLHPLITTNQTDSGPSDLQVGKMTQKRKAPANEDTDEVVKKRLAYDPSGPSVSTSSSQEAESIDLQISDTATRIGAAPALLDISSVSVAKIIKGRPRSLASAQSQDTATTLTEPTPDEYQDLVLTQPDYGVIHSTERQFSKNPCVYLGRLPGIEKDPDDTRSNGRRRPLTDQGSNNRALVLESSRLHTPPPPRLTPPRLTPPRLTPPPPRLTARPPAAGWWRLASRYGHTSLVPRGFPLRRGQARGRLFAHVRRTAAHRLEIVVVLDGHDNKTVDKSCQTDTKCEEMTRLKVENHILKKKLSNFDLLTATTQQKPFFSVDDVKNDDKQFQFYTGLTWIQFMALWNFLGPAKDDLTYYKSSKPEKSPSERPGVKRKLDPINELFLTLIRLRSGLLLNDLAYRFGISVSLVSKIVMTWIQFLYLELSKLKKPMFATRETVARTLPSCFKKFEGIRTIIDCTEFFVEQASNFEQQDNFCSSYKSRRIYKVLIAVSPSGSIMFVSDAYEGSISDVEIVKQSGFLDHLKAGDLVVAGKGFTIRDILKEKGVNLHTLPSLKGRKKLTPGEEIYTKQMARVRLHVKRSVESIKKFRLLGKVIPLSLQPLFSKMVFVAGCLVNFQEPAAT